MSDRTKYAIITSMRNEGMSLLEWVSYHRAIGFGKFVIATNDCDDGTDRMVERLAEIEDVVHIHNERVEGEAIQITALKRIMASPAMTDVLWALHIDSDEFLWVELGDHRVQDLTASLEPVDNIIVSWRMFGSKGLRRWSEALVIETFDQAEGHIRRRIVQQKSLFRVEKFRGANAHMPKRPVSANVVMKNTKGNIIPNDALLRRRASSHATAELSAMTWENADIHHYAVRSFDTFLLKNVRGIGADKTLDTRYTTGSKWWRRSDTNHVEDRAIQRFLPDVKERMAAYLADPVLGPLHKRAYDWFDALRAEYLDKRGEFGWNDLPPES